MKNTFFAALFAVAIFGASSLAAAPAVVNLEPEIGLMCKCCRPEPRSAYTVKIKGEMATDEAIKKVKDLLMDIDGVANVTIKDNTVTITMARGESTNKDAVEEALKDSGFSVESFEVNDID